MHRDYTLRYPLPVLVLALAGVIAVAGSQQGHARQPFRVLYVGRTVTAADVNKETITGMLADPERKGDFERFLAEHFTAVRTCEASEFRPELANDVDVVIVDARVPGGVPRHLGRAMVVMGGVGYFSVEKTGTKINWL